MFLELFLGGLCGFVLGMVTGLIPGLHVNLATAITVSLSAPFLLLQPYFFAALLVSAMISHNLFDFIPSVFLGAPDEADAISVLPAQKMLLLGRGVEAVYFSVIGAVAGAIIMAIISIPFWILLPVLYQMSRNFIGVALLILPFVMLLREQRQKRFFAFILIILSACLGVATFSFALKDPLLPLLSGLFGISVLLGNFSSSSKIPPQLLDLPDISIRKIIFSSGIGSLVGALLNIFPGVGPSQASILSLSITNTKRNELVIASVSAVSTGSIFGSIIALSAISKARNAPLVMLQNIVSVSGELTIAIMLLAICVLAFSALAVVFVSPFLVGIIAKFDYKTITFGILGLIFILVIWRSGIIGLLILFSGACIGVSAHKAEIGKNHLMACLLLPTAGYFLL